MLDRFSDMLVQTTRLGDYLRAARQVGGLSLRQVEGRTGVSNAYLSQLEGGKIKRPAPAVLQKLCDLYGVSYITSLQLAGHPVPDAVQGEAPELSFARRIGVVSEDEADSLVEYLAFLRSRRVR